MNVRKVAVAAVSLVLGVAVLTGCDNKFSEPFKDAKRSGQDNNDPAGVISFPDGFSNWSHKCDGPNMIYSAYHGDKAYAAGMIAPNDPRCTNR